MVITGAINFGFRSQTPGSFPPGYVMILGIKVLLVLVIASVHTFDFVHAPEAQATPALRSFFWSRTVLVIGLLIVFLAALLRHWTF